MAEVLVSERAADWLSNAEPDVRDRIRKKLREIEDFPGHYLERLSGSALYRLRIGDYRAIIDWDKEQELLRVRRIDKRDRIYDR
ncbi:MAG: type II toxin-antitoxin system RelE/ParE family toxin [Halolamina sp.]|uniref:type II toxin-antitoxin system RelE family toxin n=1 Tax=Halolamina sp. TaxID=1940283 RepID=UPI002FC27623